MVENVEEIIERVSPYYKKKKEKEGEAPEAKHELTYDSPSEQLEGIYFFILDLMRDMGLDTEKLVDNFSASAGSSYFSEQGNRATAMQQQGVQLMERVNSVARTVLNIIYDLRDFQTRLEHYDNLYDKDKTVREAARLALKQIYMDKVDMQKGNSAIKILATQGGFPMLIDAFLAAKDEKQVDDMDLNDRQKRILRPKVQDFNSWVEKSEKELRKRYDMERNYLKSQVNSLKLYSRWAKPYMKAAQQLEQKEQGTNPDMVKSFNTLILELSLLGKQKFDIKSKAKAGDLPYELSKDKYLKMFKRKYYSCVLVDFYFRGMPQQAGAQSQYTFGGKTTVTFKAYSLNEEELEKLNAEIEGSDLRNALKTIEGITDEGLERLEQDIQEFMSDAETEHLLGKKKEKEDKAKSNQGANPFLALIGHYEKSSKGSEKPKGKDDKIKSDSWLEKTYLRKETAGAAAGVAFNLFDTYKKANGMLTYT
ncbi:MAG: hypothetical protein ABEI74_00560 [Candidatus Pacearchaeota archaeon]